MGMEYRKETYKEDVDKDDDTANAAEVVVIVGQGESAVQNYKCIFDGHFLQHNSRAFVL